MTAIASTLAHFVWQGALAALLLFGANLVLRRPGARYAAACLALAAMVAVAAATYLALARHRPAALARLSSEPTASPEGATAPASLALAVALGARIPRMPPPVERTVVLCWLAGVAALTARLFGGWAAASRLTRRGVEEAPGVWRIRLANVAASLSVTRPVRLLASAIVEAPAALGVLRPVILLPVSAFTALTASELEAILAHELAHIRRHDFLVNLVQSAAETLLFYHPAVWWVSHRIRVERENACDDLAVGATGDAHLYARALLGLEEARGGAAWLAVAASGGSLLQRIERLVTPGRPGADRLPPSIAAVLALVALGVLGAAAHVAPPEPQADAAALVALPAGSASEAAPPAPTPRPAEPAPAAAAAPKAREARPASAAPAKEPAPKAEALRPLLTPAQLISFRIHGVTPEFVEELQALGYTRVSPDGLVAMRIHGVTPDYIRELNRRYGETLSVEELVEARIHGIKGDRR